jgi:peptide/nickel transport system ATP-binding protein
MRQRVMIAMALACNPTVLVADEPTTALDVTTQAEILDLIRRLQANYGMAVMLITHDMGVVAEMADDVAVMRHGRVVERGTVFDVFEHPEHAYTRMLLTAVKTLDRPSPRRLDLRAARPPGGPILSLDGVRKVFEGQRKLFRPAPQPLIAVNDVTLELRAGETLGIVGESGSGKTTLGRCVLGLFEGLGGRIVYSGRDGTKTELLGLDEEQLRPVRREIRMVFQDPFSSLNPRMTVEQIIGEPLFVNGILKGAALRERVAELLGLVGLPLSAMERYPHAFSGGQRQRIGIARAIALEPRVIVADEPTSALDVSLRSQVLDLLLDLQERLDLSFLFISHDIGVIRYFCDRVAVMYRGQVVEIGETEDVCTAPRHAYTRALLSAVPHPDPRRRSLASRHRYTEAP